VGRRRPSQHGSRFARSTPREATVPRETMGARGDRSGRSRYVEAGTEPNSCWISVRWCPESTRTGWAGRLSSSRRRIDLSRRTPPLPLQPAAIIRRGVPRAVRPHDLREHYESSCGRSHEVVSRRTRFPVVISVASDTSSADELVSRETAREVLSGWSRELRGPNNPVRQRGLRQRSG
jgi:hypothetical protein